MSVLEVAGLDADAGGDRLLRAVDLVVGPGEVLAVLGESGAGKSTLGLALLGEAAPAVRLHGRVRLGGTELLGLDEASRRRARAGRIGHLPQHPGAVLDPVRRIGVVLRELAALVHRKRRPRQDAVAAACEAARLDPGLLRRFPHQLSGGQQQRAALAQTLVTGPAVLVLDEPTTGLDPTTAAELVDRLTALATGGTALVLLTHDRAVARALGGRALVLERGRAVRRGTVAEVLGPQAATTARQAGPEPHPPGSRCATCGFLMPRAARCCAGSTSTPGPASCSPSSAGRGPGRPPSGGASPGSRPGAAPSRSTASGSRLASVAGPRPSAAPSSTYTRTPARPSSNTGPSSTRSRGPRSCSAARSRPARSQAAGLLERLGLDPDACRRRPRSLSGGQLQRAAMARALVSRPAVLVCDEVTSALDADNRDQLLHAIDALRRDHDTTVLLITHDLPLGKRGRRPDRGRGRRARRALDPPPHLILQPDFVISLARGGPGHGTATA
nr:ATP-binding cassette domain-containing protein [Pseudonocardia sp. H11422]